MQACVYFPKSNRERLLPTDVFANAPATRGRGSERSATDGVATQGTGAGPRGTQVSVRQRGPLLLRADGRRQRRLRTVARVTTTHTQTLRVRSNINHLSKRHQTKVR